MVNESHESFFETFIAGRLHIGASMSVSSADKRSVPHERAFLGNLDTLDEDTKVGYGLNVKYDICDYFAVLFANDINIDLGAWNNGSLSKDGALLLNGFVLEGIVQYPLYVNDDCTVVPYIGLGVAEMTAGWRYANWWHYGWSSPEDYDTYANGSKEFHNHYSRWMIPDDPSAAFVWSAGLCLNVFQHLDLDFSYRHVNVDDIETNFRVRRRNGPIMRSGAFPAKHSSFCVAVRYVF